VILDATIVRCLLVPALMVLMGKVNWYIPRWLERILPHINIEGAEFFRKRDRRRAVEPQPEREPVAASTAG
jgi:RND superfamily putative drug exporter